MYTCVLDQRTMPISILSQEYRVLIDIQSSIAAILDLLESNGNELMKGFIVKVNGNTLEPHQTLSEHCFPGDGVVQVNLRIDRYENVIVITNVIVPTDETLKELECTHKTRFDSNIPVSNEEITNELEHVQPMFAKDSSTRRIRTGKKGVLRANGFRKHRAITSDLLRQTHFCEGK